MERKEWFKMGTLSLSQVDWLEGQLVEGIKSVTSTEKKQTWVITKKEQEKEKEKKRLRI